MAAHDIKKKEERVMVLGCSGKPCMGEGERGKWLMEVEVDQDDRGRRRGKLKKERRGNNPPSSI